MIDHLLQALPGAPPEIAVIILLLCVELAVMRKVPAKQKRMPMMNALIGVQLAAAVLLLVRTLAENL